jgi:hypothetical protein
VSDITSKYSTAVVFVMINMSNISQTTLSNVFMTHFSIKFHILVPSGSLAITTKPKSKYRFCAVAHLLYYVLQKTTVINPAYFLEDLLPNNFNRAAP